MRVKRRWLADAPPIDRAAVEERRGRHHAVLLEHRAVLHHELHGLQRVDVGERIAWDGDQIAGSSINYVVAEENKVYNRERGYVGSLSVIGTVEVFERLGDWFAILPGVLFQI